uniref:EF-hand domain-containing protein n=1 Tax=Phytophthora ramorum TaxID=164328 RepID=H3HDV4_PHYRM
MASKRGVDSKGLTQLPAVAHHNGAATNTKHPVATPSALSPTQFLGRMSWEKGMLDNASYRGCKETPAVPHPSPTTLKKSGKAGSRPMTMEESYDQVEKMLAEHMHQQKESRPRRVEALTTVGERSPLPRHTFVFAPLDDSRMLSEIAVQEAVDAREGFSRSEADMEIDRDVANGRQQVDADEEDDEEKQTKLLAGGQAMGAMLTANITLEQLDLSWNQLRAVGTAFIAAALPMNYQLRELDLSYNSLGNKGALSLAHALRAGARLRRLTVSYNGISPRGGVGLASGLAVNTSLSLLILDGNPLGAQGGKALMHASCAPRSSTSTTSSVCQLSLMDCSLNVSAPTMSATGDEQLHVFNPMDPAGSYVLDLSDAYEYMSFNPVALLFRRLDEDGSGSVELSELLNALRSYGLNVSDEQLTELLQKYDYDKSGALHKREFADLFARVGFTFVDGDSSGSLDVDELRRVFQLLGVSEEVEINDAIARMIAKYDLDGSGEIDAYEFLEFMTSEVLTVPDDPQTTKDNEEAKLMRLQPCEVGSGAVWQIPSSGQLAADLVHSGGGADAGDVANKQHQSQTGADSGGYAGETHRPSDSVLMPDVILARFLLNASSGVASSAVRPGRRLAALARLLPRMIDHREAASLVTRVVDIHNQWLERLALRRWLGTQLFTLHRLALIAQEEKQFSRWRSGRADTSQSGNWENFRVATLDAQPPDENELSALCEDRRGDTEQDHHGSADNKKQMQALLHWEILRRSVMTDRWLSSSQAQEIVQTFPNAVKARAKAACLTFSRIVDLENFIQIYDVSLF